MDKYGEQYQVWGGGLSLPRWTDADGWQEGSFTITALPGTPVPAWFQKMLRSKKHLTDIEKLPLIGG